MTSAQTDLESRLFTEILLAKTRVYRAGAPTPLERIRVPDIEAEVFVKREDLSPIHAYKWRGAFNCTAVLKEHRGATCVVAASAGNHAQGVALAARMLGISGKIFMPVTTPLMKQNAVRLHGGDAVEIILTGDTFDQASAQANEYSRTHGHPIVHPFDDLYTIAGQATIADELVRSSDGPFDFLFLQVGGGGLAAGVSSWLKRHHPRTRVLGVEGVGQASMKASLDAGKPVVLDEVDTFCDGTAVKTPGALTFEICRGTLERVLTVSNEEVCAGIQRLWESSRVIPEPSGAMGLAGLTQFALANPEQVRGRKLLAIVCGANMDFGKLAMISSQAAIGAQRKRCLRFTIAERNGSLLDLLDRHFPDLNVSEFQYGKTSLTAGHPVIAFEATPERIDALFDELQGKGVPFEDVTGETDIRFRIIPYNPGIMRSPAFFHVHFPERRGALREFMRRVSSTANVCYFNYAYSGESIGRAIMGFEFDEAGGPERLAALTADGVVTCRPLAHSAAKRLLAGRG